jgi:hypothetical protein
MRGNSTRGQDLLEHVHDLGREAGQIRKVVVSTVGALH